MVTHEVGADSRRFRWDARGVTTRDELAPIVEISEMGALPDVVPCDVRWYLDGRSGRDAYDGGHLPGAVFVDLDQHLTSTLDTEVGPEVGRHPLPTPEAFARSMGALGIGPDDPVVAYDDAGGMAAGRLVWMLRVLGRPAALLNGGVAAWSGPLETSPTVRSPTVVPSQPWPTSAVASIEEVAEVATTGGAGELVLDARGAERYRGEVEPVDPRAGHVPGARNAPFAGNLEADGPRAGGFRSPGDLAARYEALGVVDAADVIAYCGSGVSACHNLLAMEHAGLGRGRLFVGSWSQWSQSDRPAAVGPEPG